MKRSSSFARFAVCTAIILFVMNRTQAQEAPPAAAPQGQSQTPAAAQSQKDTKKTDDDEDFFAPQPAPALPPGMTGSDPNDPRAKLSPGLYDAGEASMGMEHLLLLKKPDAFQLGTTDPNDPKVEKIVGQLGLGNNKKIPKPAHLL
ncbi:MAG: hypothetical protein WAK21_03435, partial [Candidatus Sulfotelmatobacter sp.]